MPAKSAALKPVHQRTLENFDKLPDSAKVPIEVLAARECVSVDTIARRVRSGILPRPEKVGNTTRWRVGDIRAHEAAA